jgi:pilus assembly protein CpaD
MAMVMTTGHGPRSLRRPGRVLALLAGTLALGACAAKGDLSASLAPDDIRERHPIVLRDAPRSLDVFVGRSGSGLDPRQADDVARFGADYRRSGKGGLVAEVPTGTGRDLAAHDAAASRRGRSRCAPTGPSIRSSPRRSG